MINKRTYLQLILASKKNTHMDCDRRKLAAKTEAKAHRLEKVYFNILHI